VCLPEVDDSGFLPSTIVGGVWTMKREMIEDVFFEPIETCKGIKGAFPIINQIANIKKPRIGWTDRVVFDDIGYWGGTHPDHIKSKEHELYSAEIGRPIAWKAEEVNK